jgi:hypothetical protein
MIWFSCSQCGKALSRPESSAGAFIFCACGQGQVVPWDSTLEAPPGAVPAEAPQEPPPLRPIPVGEEKLPLPRRPPPVPPRDRDDRRDESDDRPRIAVGPTVRNRDKCLNHQDRPVQEKCADCNEGFCPDCLLHFQGRTLCGPCKNYRLRTTERPGTFSNKAWIAAALAMGTAVCVSCVWPFGATGMGLLVSVLALFAEAGAMILGGLALRETDVNPRLSGRALAITSMLTGGLAGVLTLGFMLFGPR